MEYSYKPKAGELEAMEVLGRAGYEVELVSGDCEYWYKDIDIIAQKDTTVETIEVKWDRRISKTSNLFIEHTSDYEQHKAGWYKFCEADYLLYGDWINGIFYKIPFDEVKRLIAARTKRGIIKEKSAIEYHLNGKQKNQYRLYPSFGLRFRGREEHRDFICRRTRGKRRMEAFLAILELLTNITWLFVLIMIIVKTAKIKEKKE